MPLFQKAQNNLETKNLFHSRPFIKKSATLNREELEYTAKHLLIYGTLTFTAVGVYAYLA
jgi:hypothetical protein